jgi:hypothetical protein
MNYISAIRSLGLGLLALGMSTGCHVTSAHHIRFDARDPSKSTLCTRDSDMTPDEEAKCAPLAGQSLEAPGPVSIEVVRYHGDGKLALEVESTSTGPASLDPNAVLAEILRRMNGLGSALARDIGTDLPEPALAAMKSETGKAVLDHIAAAAVQVRPDVRLAIDRLASNLVPPTPPAERSITSEGLFRPWLPDGKQGLEPPQGQQLLGSPAHGYAPARFAVFDDGDLQFLESKQRGVGALADHVIRFCSPQSFGTADSQNHDWLAYLKAANLRDQDVLEALLIDEALIQRVVAGEPPVFSTRLGKLLDEAGEARDAGKDPQGPARVAYVISSASRIRADLEVCEKNIEFLKATPVDQAKKTALDQARKSLEELKAAAASPSELYDRYLSPLVTRVAYATIEGAYDNNAISFGTFGVRPGEITLNVREEKGAEQRSVSRVTFPVVAGERVTVGVGLFTSLCSECFQEVEEGLYVVEATDPAAEPGAPTRRLGISKRSFSYGFAAMLNVGLFSSTNHQLAASLGYPVTGSSAESILAGLSYRVRPGFQAGIGVHLFAATRLKVGYPETINLGIPENATLTAEMVTESRPAAAGYFFVGFSPDLFSKQ